MVRSRKRSSVMGWHAGVWRGGGGAQQRQAGEVPRLRPPHTIIPSAHNAQCSMKHGRGNAVAMDDAAAAGGGGGFFSLAFDRVVAARPRPQRCWRSKSAISPEASAQRKRTS
eukprot:scaffold31771_cov129-Isochrysis_galbana.AAC.8